MTTRYADPGYATFTPSTERAAKSSLRYLVPLGRVLFASIFVLTASSTFDVRTIGYGASHGVPLASVLVPLAGMIGLAGGLSVTLGFKTRIGAFLLALFLVPVTLAMHDFWNVADPQEAQMQMISFMKNLSLLGGTILIAYFGAGPISVDERGR